MNGAAANIVTGGNGAYSRLITASFFMLGAIMVNNHEFNQILIHSGTRALPSGPSAKSGKDA